MQYGTRKCAIETTWLITNMWKRLKEVGETHGTVTILLLATSCMLFRMHCVTRLSKYADRVFRNTIIEHDFSWTTIEIQIEFCNGIIIRNSTVVVHQSPMMMTMILYECEMRTSSTNSNRIPNHMSLARILCNRDTSKKLPLLRPISDWHHLQQLPFFINAEKCRKNVVSWEQPFAFESNPLLQTSV